MRKSNRRSRRVGRISVSAPMLSRNYAPCQKLPEDLRAQGRVRRGLRFSGSTPWTVGIPPLYYHVRCRYYHGQSRRLLSSSTRQTNRSGPIAGSPSESSGRHNSELASRHQVRDRQRMFGQSARARLATTIIDGYASAGPLNSSEDRCKEGRAFDLDAT